MINDLLINGVDAYSHGVVMGDDFINTLRTPISFKDDIENDSAIEHGIRVIPSAYYSAREITLTFNVHGSDSASCAANEEWLRNLLAQRAITIKVRDEEYYRLLYKASVSYGRNCTKTTCVISAKFLEPNPDDRAETPKNSLFQL